MLCMLCVLGMLCGACHMRYSMHTVRYTGENIGKVPAKVPGRRTCPDLGRPGLGSLFVVDLAALRILVTVLRVERAFSHPCGAVISHLKHRTARGSTSISSHPYDNNSVRQCGMALALKVTKQPIQ